MGPRIGLWNARIFESRWGSCFPSFLFFFKANAKQSFFRQINRIERQAFGSSYKMDLFRNFDAIYVSPKCACKQLKELVTLCHGKTAHHERQARYIICESIQSHIDSQKCLQLHPNWILDSISAGKIQKYSKYIVKPNVWSFHNLDWNFLEF